MRNGCLTYAVETYDPATHHFEGIGSLHQKRASAAAVELSNGQVLIAGNWYGDDSMELFDGGTAFLYHKATKQSRNLPHLFRTSDGDVLMVSGYDAKGLPIDTPLVERMKGEALSLPLFETWCPLHYDLPLHSDDSFIGDREKGRFAYLMPVQNQDGQVAIVEVRDTVFSLLPTDSPVPVASQWGHIYYYTSVYADRQHQQGYVMGCDSTGRQYALCINYGKKPAKLTLYHTDQLTDTLALTIPVMLEDGNLMLTGVKPAIGGSLNFYPTSQVWLLRFHDKGEAVAASPVSTWLWACLALLAVIATAVGFTWWKRKGTAVAEAPRSDEQLMQRITLLMEEQQLYLRHGLKVSDVATKVGAGNRRVAECIKAATGNSFADFVNNYRISYAKQLLRQQPNTKAYEIWFNSGFSNEQTFYRIFKTITGMTPNEWKNS